MEKQTSAIKNFLAGGVGGACAILVGQPLDIIKLRLQTQPKPKPGEKPLYAGTWDCMKKTIRTERFIGLYKGMSVPLLMTTPIMAVYFTGFGIGKKLQQSDPNVPLTPLQIFNAGLIAGLFSSTITTPAERVKILLQIQQSGSGVKVHSGPVSMAKALYKEGGIRTFYRGVIPTLCRDVPGSGTYFFCYMSIRRALASEGQEDNLSPLHIILAGGTAGVLGWLVGIGPDVVKSRLQMAPEGRYPKGWRSVVMELLTKEGPGALFKGTGPVVIRAFPGNAALFLGYEVAIKFMNWIAPDV